MAKKIRNDGSLVFTATEAVVNGQLTKVGDLVGVATRDFATGEVAVIYLVGSFEVDAKDGDTFTVGQRVYFDTTTKSATVTKGTNTPVGYVFTPPATTGTNRKLEVLLRNG